MPPFLRSLPLSSATIAFFAALKKACRKNEDADGAARDFAPDQATQAEGILCVFRGLGSAELGQKIR